MRFILAGSLLAGLNGRSVDLIARNGDARSGRAAAIVRPWRWSTPARIVGCGDASSRSVATAGDLVPSSAMAMLQLDVRGSGRLGIVGCGDARARRKNRLGVSEAASLHAVQGGRNRAGDQGGKPRGLMCSSATLAGFFDLSDASGPPWALLDLLLLFLDVLLPGAAARRAALLQS